MKRLTCNIFGGIRAEKNNSVCNVFGNSLSADWYWDAKPVDSFVFLNLNRRVPLLGQLSVCRTRQYRIRGYVGDTRDCNFHHYKLRGFFHNQVHQIGLFGCKAYTLLFPSIS